MWSNLNLSSGAGATRNCTGRQAVVLQVCFGHSARIRLAVGTGLGRADETELKTLQLLSRSRLAHYMTKIPKSSNTSHEIHGVAYGRVLPKRTKTTARGLFGLYSMPSLSDFNRFLILEFH